MADEELENGILKLIQERKTRKKNKQKELSPEQKKQNVKKWCSFYRRNINLYASRHLLINLHPFQHIMMYLMGVSQVFFAICSRGASKTFIVALFALCKALLFPYSEIHITASTIRQAKKMIDKMQNEICNKVSPILKYYYDKGLIVFHLSKEEIWVEIKINNSKIWVDVADESSRGGRATLIIYEECRLLKKSIIDSVFEPMAHPRQAKFITLPEYNGDSRWIEECQSISITSARFKSEWFWNNFKTVVNECFTNKKIQYNFFASDIFLAICHGLKTKSDYFKQKKSSSDLDFRMESLNEMLGEAEDAFFKRELLQKNQIIRKAFVPPTTQDIVVGINLKNRAKKPNERRLLWIDCAFANTTSTSENDNSVIGCISVVPKDRKFKRIVDYITTWEASDSVGLDRRIRELYWDYEADYIVLDLRNGGEVIYNDLTKEWQHPERPADKWNPHGFTVSNEFDLQVVSRAKLDDLIARTVDKQPIPCIIPITATDETNSIMWLDLQKRFRDEEIDLLIDDMEYDKILEDNKNYLSLTAEEKATKKMPYVQTMLLIYEAVNLSQKWNNGKVKLSEPRTGTKDRIVALSYGNYISTLIENKQNKTLQSGGFDINEWKFLSKF